MSKKHRRNNKKEKRSRKFIKFHKKNPELLIKLEKNSPIKKSIFIQQKVKIIFLISLRSKKEEIKIKKIIIKII